MVHDSRARIRLSAAAASLDQHQCERDGFALYPNLDEAIAAASCEEIPLLGKPQSGPRRRNGGFEGGRKTLGIDMAIVRKLTWPASSPATGDTGSSAPGAAS